MTDTEALAKAREWFGPTAVARIGTERGGIDERYVGPATGDTIHAYGTGRTWEECFANVPKLYQPGAVPDLAAHNRLLRDALLLASAALPPGSPERREAVATLMATEPTEPPPT